MPVVVTWNMQGANWSDDMKWRTGVANLFSNGADIALLQECGPVPASAALQWVSPANPLLRQYTWGGTATRPGKHILFYHWDVLGGNRVNMAIVSRLPFAAIRPVVVSVTMHWRPAIGVTINGANYYCIHAISPGGPDVPGLLAAIAIDSIGTNFYVGGDFNRVPANHLLGVWFLAADGNTHSTRQNHPASMYDYMYTDVANDALTVGERAGLIASDHFPVVYTF